MERSKVRLNISFVTDIRIDRCFNKQEKSIKLVIASLGIRIGNSGKEFLDMHGFLYFYLLN